MYNLIYIAIIQYFNRMIGNVPRLFFGKLNMQNQERIECLHEKNNNTL
ncbi:hypothetical protein [Sulfurihydrogenibium sp. YO3AOP1]|nr:hypothetical protein [Sulfurihydrogenibium sp. YO3AOP1]